MFCLGYTKAFHFFKNIYRLRYAITLIYVNSQLNVFPYCLPYFFYGFAISVLCFGVIDRQVMGLVLGSVISFVIFLAYPFIIAKRIRHEEALLEKELDGYREYRQKVKYRLIPFVW